MTAAFKNNQFLFNAFILIYSIEIFPISIGIPVVLIDITGTINRRFNGLLFLYNQHNPQLNKLRSYVFERDLMSNIVTAADEEIAYYVFETNSISYTMGYISGNIPEKFQLLVGD